MIDIVMATTLTGNTTNYEFIIPTNLFYKMDQKVLARCRAEIYKAQSPSDRLWALAGLIAEMERTVKDEPSNILSFPQTHREQLSDPESPETGTATLTVLDEWRANRHKDRA